MKIYHENDIVRGESAVALGNFDGLHVAHTKIIRRGIAYAKEHGLKSGVLMFEEHSASVLKTRRITLITPNEAKIELLEREAPDFAYIRPFTKEYMHLSPEDFVKRLIGYLNMKAVCVGYDYRFGYRAAGDVRTLKELGEKYGFGVLVTPAVRINGEIVSSTAIREMIEAGDMEKAELFLGRRFCVEGRVEKGLQNGRRLGFPTANVGCDPRMTIPMSGVYAGVSYVRGKRLPSVINVGRNPTFGGGKVTIESHIPGFCEDIYGEYIRVSFAKRLRGEIKFESPERLAEQIRRDAEQVRGMNL